MPAPIIIAHHLIWTVYGCWLPNDPRGSYAKQIASDLIAPLGDLHYGRKKVQPASRDIRPFYEQAGALLKYPLLSMLSAEVEAIGAAFAEVILRHKYTCYACAIMPDHVHILIRKHEHLAEEMILNFQSLSRLRLSHLGLRSHEHPTWTAGGGWKVFLDSPDDIRRTIGYIQDNPTKIRQPQQSWGFVKEYDGWPLHPGHSSRSPYARRLRGEG